MVFSAIRSSTGLGQPDTLTPRVEAIDPTRLAPDLQVVRRLTLEQPVTTPNTTAANPTAGGLTYEQLVLG